ncbi:MAG: hypothetical protein ABIG37_02715 [Nanoarchaeota archaeon]|nr:hypothetical protein [Nanoarchaeota archaeon]
MFFKKKNYVRREELDLVACWGGNEVLLDVLKLNPHSEKIVFYERHREVYNREAKRFNSRDLTHECSERDYFYIGPRASILE